MRNIATRSNIAWSRSFGDTKQTEIQGSAQLPKRKKAIPLWDGLSLY